jgi:hypothetical protein
VGHPRGNEHPGDGENGNGHREARGKVWVRSLNMDKICSKA